MRKYSVYTLSDRNSEKITEYFIAVDNGRIVTARFPLNDANDSETQKERALDYAYFLNLQEKAMEEARREITIGTAVAEKMIGKPK